MRRFKLIGRLAVPCGDLIEWAIWYGAADRRVAKDVIGCLHVSTVFLGLDHRFSFDRGDPVLFETMIFGDDADSYQTRCCTWDEAERMHTAAVIVAASWVARAAADVAKIGTSQCG